MLTNNIESSSQQPIPPKCCSGTDLQWLMPCHVEGFSPRQSIMSELCACVQSHIYIEKWCQVLQRCKGGGGMATLPPKISVRKLIRTIIF